MKSTGSSAEDEMGKAFITVLVIVAAVVAAIGTCLFFAVRSLIHHRW